MDWIHLKDCNREDGEKLPSYAWPGGYPILYLDGHNESLCPDCANAGEQEAKELGSDYIDTRDLPVTMYIHYEGPPEFCAECNKQTESAYGDPDAEEEDNNDCD
jgi:hypothetical protein